MNKGFGLIELMIAMTIFGMGLLAATALHYSISRNNTGGNVITIAHMAAKQELETLRCKNISDLVEGVTNKQVGLVSLDISIMKDPNNIRFGRVIVTAKVRNNKTIQYETTLNNNKIL